MKKLFLFLFLSLHTLIANDYVLVIHTQQKLPKLSQKKVQMLYLKKLSMIANKHILPINLAFNAPIRQSFERNVLRISKRKLKDYWYRQHYLGHQPPLVLSSPQAALAFVKQVDGALVYLPQKLVTDDLQILFRWSD
jgi:hypothetical protein